MAHRGSRGIALSFLDHGTRRGWGVCVTPQPHLTPGKDTVLIVQEAGWAPEPVWTGVENLDPTGIWSIITRQHRYTVTWVLKISLDASHNRPPKNYKSHDICCQHRCICFLYLICSLQVSSAHQVTAYYHLMQLNPAATCIWYDSASKNE